jgi:ABC-2 type transport system ATP-binding protein
MRMDVISIDQLTYNYGRRRGIEEVSLAVKAGEIFGFLGPNGAGKTTTIRILLGLLRSTGGTARILNLDCWSQSAEIKQQVGYLPGDLRLYSWFTASNALQILCAVRGQSDVLKRGREFVERFQLDEKVPVRKMSRGMRQKLGIVLALAHNPRLLILDEPTSGLDPLMCDVLYDCLRKAAATGTTVFFSSHTLSEVELLCERVAIVRAGQIVADESMDVLRRRAHRIITLRFASDSNYSSFETPSFLEIKERTPFLWRGELIGTTQQLIAWAATMPIDELEIGPPSLDSLFRRYYEPEEAVV